VSKKRVLDPADSKASAIHEALVAARDALLAGGIPSELEPGWGFSGTPEARSVRAAAARVCLAAPNIEDFNRLCGELHNMLQALHETAMFADETGLREEAALDDLMNKPVEASSE